MRDAALLFLGVLAVVIAWFGSAAWGGTFLADWSLGRDIYHLSTLYERTADHVLGGTYPAWLPEFQGGYPVQAAWMYGLTYPPLLLFGVLPAQVAWAWVSALHVAFGALGAFLLLRSWVDEVPAAVAGALVFALSEFCVGRVLNGHLNLVTCVAWAPWVLLNVRRAALGARGATGWLALCFGAGLVAGHVQMWFYLGPLAAAYAGFLALERTRRAAVLSRVVPGLAVGVGIAAVQWLPTIELYTLGLREPFDVGVTSTPGHVIAGKLVPGLFGRMPDTYWGVGFPHEYLALAGPVAIFLALVGVARKGDRERWFWAATALVGVLLALGGNSLFGNVVGHLPLLSAAREPGRALVLVLIAASALTAYAVAGWTKAEAAERKRALMVAGVAMAVLSVAAWASLSSWYGGLAETIDAGRGSRTPAQAFAEVGPASIGLALLALGFAVGACIVAPRWRHGAWAFAAVVGVQALLGGVPPAQTTATGFYTTDWLEEMPEAARIHRVALANARFPMVERQGGRTDRQMCHVDTAGMERFRTLPPRVRALWQDVAVVAAGSAPWGPRAVDGPASVVTEAVATLGPGALFTRSTPSAVSDDDVLAQLRTGQRLLFLSDGVLSGIAGSVERMPGTDPNRVTLQTDGPAGTLFVSERFYPGWEATVDGAPIEIMRANLAFQALELPAGRHEVVLEYRPGPLRWGFWISVLGLAGAGFLALRRPRSLSE